ncbi:MAG: hypothetical protein ACFCD0_20000 [Gemmataceae bacterium]
MLVEDDVERDVSSPTHNSPTGIDTHPWMVVIRFGVLVLISAFFVFAHGCHGDEDNELFASALRVIDWSN